jgi:SOS-response transcriptional repressor LexA
LLVKLLDAVGRVPTLSAPTPFCLNMTKHRQLVLDFIRAYIRLHGVPPSYEVIAKGIGLSSKSNVHRIVHRLKEDGHLTIRPYKFHSIKLVDKSVKEMAAL